MVMLQIKEIFKVSAVHLTSEVQLYHTGRTKMETIFSRGIGGYIPYGQLLSEGYFLLHLNQVNVSCLST